MILSNDHVTGAERPPLSRRRFLRGLGAAAGLLAAGCRPSAGIESLAPSSTPTSLPTGTPLPSPTPGVTPTATASPTGTPLPAATSPAATAPPTAGPTAAPVARSRVALARAESYDAALLRHQLESALGRIGGLRDVITPGDRVAIKVNLTGGTAYEAQAGAPAVESYVTHPQVVQALGELLRDAGAGELAIVEAVFDDTSFGQWGYEAVATSLGAALVDLNDPLPYPDFASLPVQGPGLAYNAFTVHPVVAEADVLVSVAKLKCHYNCGVTLALKNLIGLVPVRHYALAEDHWSRSALHGSEEESVTRLPQVIADLNRARRIDLAVTDGIRTAAGGEGPWHAGFAPVAPRVLIAGKDPVAADAVATAVMGFDPQAGNLVAPFLRSHNHLALAHSVGLGTHRLDDIHVLGVPIDQVAQPFALSEPAQ